VSAAIQKRWTPHELNVLDQRRDAGVAPRFIARELHRSVASVVNRIQRPYKRRLAAKLRERCGLPDRRVQFEPQYVAPPPYVLRERVIRYSIPQTSLTQMVFHDPVAGYSALAAKARKLSVQDALEICALYTGKRGEIITLAASYSVSPAMVSRVLGGQFFESLLRFDDAQRDLRD
jgi:hypothetical protein